MSWTSILDLIFLRSFKTVNLRPDANANSYTDSRGTDGLAVSVFITDSTILKYMYSPISDTHKIFQSLGIIIAPCN